MSFTERLETTQETVHFLNKSKTKTVPILIKKNSEVIEESLEIILWALSESSKQNFKLIYFPDDKKEDIFKEFGKSKKDTGSAESQVALFSKRIDHLSNHLKTNAKDFNTEKSLVKMVGKRRNLLEYLKKTDIGRYRDIIKKLGIRK